MTVTNHRRRRAAVAIGAAVAALVGAAGASAHAVVSPPDAVANKLQQYTLSVPTEQDGVTTTRIALRVPSGFSIDSFEPPPAGWRMQVRSTGSGEEAVVREVVWSGGKVPTGQDSVFRFNAVATASHTYLFPVVQTYSDGSVVRWIGPETSDSPAPVLDVHPSATTGAGWGGIATFAMAAAALAAALASLAYQALRPFRPRRHGELVVAARPGADERLRRAG